jgi:type VI secretion system protein ImpL
MSADNSLSLQTYLTRITRVRLTPAAGGKRLRSAGDDATLAQTVFQGAWI